MNRSQFGCHPSVVRGHQTQLGHMVVNMGVEGYGVPQLYQKFSEIQADIEPDDIVIFAVIGDDIHRTWPDLIFVSITLFGRMPLQHFPVFENGALRIQETGSFASKLKALMVHAPWIGSVSGPLLLPPAENAMEDAAQMFSKVRDAVERKGARFMLVQLPTMGELLENQAALDLSRYGAVQLKKGFPMDRESMGACFISDDGHYSPKGHGLVGDLLHEELMERGWTRLIRVTPTGKK